MKDENQVFVSYGHVEEEMCKDICAYLSENGFKPWVDTSKLQHGMLWRDEIRKGIEDAKKNLIKVALKGTTIPHEITGKFGAGVVLLKPAAPGTGVIAGGPVRAVVETVGIKDIRSKALRSNNPCNVVRATIDGLSKLRNAEEVAAIRGKSVKEIIE